MEISKVIIVKVGDLEFPIRYSNRAFLMHLNRSTKDPDNPDNLVLYFFDLARSGAKAEGKEFAYTLESFFETIDPCPDFLSNFNKAMSEMFQAGEEGKKPMESSE